jgi:hypothetical protein
MGLGVGAALAVLPGAEKEEESHDGQIGGGELALGGGWEAGDGVLDVDEESERDGSHSGWRGVLLVVGAELTGQPEVGVAEVVVSGVFGPHAGEDLGHGAKVLLHGPLANRPTVGGKVAGADLVGKELEQWDGILDAGKGGVEAESRAENAPLSPVGAVGGLATGMDASGNLVLAKAVESPCCCAGVRWSIVQDVACGKARLKKEQSCESERSQRREAASARWLSLPARKVVGAAIRCCRRSQDRRRSREPAAWEVLVLPLRIHQMDVELSDPLSIAERGSIFGSASHSWATLPASSKSLMVRSPLGLDEETSRADSEGLHGWRHR